ncbi:MAG TPA: SlyX family protein [Verrucomicrobiae bacterium]|nr:SlyX family protein [Verrucomicrobiae bacterium]
MSDEAAERLQRIEATIAHLEHQVEQLNGVVIEQGKELEKLKRVVQRQAQTLESIELERVKSTNPKPPHYGS